MGDLAAVAVGDVERARPIWADEQVLLGGGPSCLSPPNQRLAGDTPNMLEAAGGCCLCDVSEQSELEARHAHDGSICANDVAGDRR